MSLFINERKLINKEYLFSTSSISDNEQSGWYSDEKRIMKYNTECELKAGWELKIEGKNGNASKQTVYLTLIGKRRTNNELISR